MNRKCPSLLQFLFPVIHLHSLANLLLEFIHGQRDALLPRLLVFLLHGRLQVLLQLLIQLGDRESTSESVGGRQKPANKGSSSWWNICFLPSDIPLYPGSAIQTQCKTHARESQPAPPKHSLDL